jgi:Domain of unknown function (DUF1906)
MAVPKPAPASNSRSAKLFTLSKRPPSGGFFILCRILRIAGGRTAPMKKLYLAFFALAIGAGNAQADLSCDAHAGYSAVDMSQPVTSIETKTGKTGLEAFKSIGIKTIARYYAWPEENISCKTLLPPESDAIIAAGLSIITVFQHENDNPETFFIHDRGVTDAKRAMQLAGANGQPHGSAIYFAVDGIDQTISDLVFEHGMSNGRAMSAARQRKLLRADRAFGRHIRQYARFLKYHNNVFHKPVPSIRPQDIHPAITHYFQSIKDEFDLNPGYKVGAYASGAVCDLLFSKGLIDYCWLAQSTGWPGYNQFYTSNKWSMVQQKSTFCSVWKFRGVEKVRFDFNKVNPAQKDYGQWSKKGEVTKLAKLPTTCTMNW